MKRILCRIAQLQPESNRSQTCWPAKHLKSCQDCRTFIEKTNSLEALLRSETHTCDENLCDSIMAEIRIAASVADQRPAPAIQPRFTWNPWLLGGAGLAAALAVMILVTSHSKPHKELHVGTRTEVVQPVISPPASIEENNSLAQMMHQQKLLQRDTRKLVAHLRENVILFQAGN